MTNAQQQLYFFEWNRARKWYLAHGFDPKQADNKRHLLHRQALGYDKSSKSFLNAELDKVLAAFRAVYDGGNLDSQLRQDSMADDRRAVTLQRCYDVLLRRAWAGHDPQFFDPDRRTAYIEGTAAKIAKKKVAECSERELQQILGALHRSLQVMEKKLKPEQPF